MFTSMFDEPSSGSYTTTYFPARWSAGTGTGSSSSSDAVTHTRPVYWMALRTVLLAKTSSFCWTSPCTLVVPKAPRISFRPARRTWWEIILAARQMSYSRFDNSPVASGKSRSCSMMNRSIVTTDVGSSTVPFQYDGDGAFHVRATQRYPPLHEPRQDLRRRMPVAIPRAHAHDGDLRLDLAEPRVTRGGA